MAGEDWLDRLPHGDGFRFVSEVCEVRPDEHAAAVWRVSGSEAFLASHFPGDPIVPGVLLAEALAQAAGCVVDDGPAGDGSDARSRALLLCHIDVRLHEPVRPPAEIRLEARLVRGLGGLFLFEVAARVGDMVAASGRLTLSGRGRLGEEQER